MAGSMVEALLTNNPLAVNAVIVTSVRTELPSTQMVRDRRIEKEYIRPSLNQQTTGGLIKIRLNQEEV